MPSMIIKENSDSYQMICPEIGITYYSPVIDYDGFRKRAEEKAHQIIVNHLSGSIVDEAGYRNAVAIVNDKTFGTRAIQ